MTEQDKLVASILSAINMEGGLWQRHPEHPDWETTRPGARTGEVAAFVREVEGERKAFISVCRWYEGETDVENGYTYPHDCWEIIHDKPDGTSEYDRATEAEDMARGVAQAMRSYD